MIWKQRARLGLTEDKPLLGPIVILPMALILGLAAIIAVVVLT